MLAFSCVNAVPGAAARDGEKLLERMEHDVVFERLAGRRKHRAIGVLAVAVGFGLAACSSGSPTTATSAPAAASSTSIQRRGRHHFRGSVRVAGVRSSRRSGVDLFRRHRSRELGQYRARLRSRTDRQSIADRHRVGRPRRGDAGDRRRGHDQLPADRLRGREHRADDRGRSRGCARRFITIDGKKFYLQQFHLHNPSEHTVDNASFGMELHLVNKSDDGALAVLGVLMNTGDENSPLAELFSKMPTTKTDENSMVALDEKIDPSDLIPVGSKVARYSGSLTTPPCTEPVIWSVFLTPSSVPPRN